MWGAHTKIVVEKIILFKGYHMSSMIYLYMHEQMQILNELVSSGCSCLCTWCIQVYTKSLNKCNNAITSIIYMLVDF